MAVRLSGVQALADLISERRRSVDPEIVLVAISGFGGSGKTTLASELRTALVAQWRCVVVAGDDFLTPDCDVLADEDWGALDRNRLTDQVIEPSRRHGGCFTYERYCYTDQTMAVPTVVCDAQIVIVESVGLIHAPFDAGWDLTVWVDVPLEVAAERGKARDVAFGSGHADRWDELWAPNDRAYFDRHRPDLVADVLWGPVEDVGLEGDVGADVETARRHESA